MNNKWLSKPMLGALAGFLAGLLLVTVGPLASATWLLVLVTAGLLVATWKQANASHRAVEEMRRQGEPSVVLFFHVDPGNEDKIYIVLKNFGLRPAYNIEIAAANDSPPLRTNFPDIDDFLSGGASFLAPGQSLRRVFRSRDNVFPESGAEPDAALAQQLDYDVQVSWDDESGEKRWTVKQPVSLRDFGGWVTSS